MTVKQLIEELSKLPDQDREVFCIQGDHDWSEEPVTSITLTPKIDIHSYTAKPTKDVYLIEGE